MSEPQIEITDEGGTIAALEDNIDADARQQGRIPVGVQEASSGSTPIQIDELDLLKYHLAAEKHSKAQLVIDMCQREMQHAQIDLVQRTQELRRIANNLESKYKVSLQTHVISEDGYLLPRPNQLQLR